MGFIMFFQSLASVLPCWICLPNLFNSISGSFHSWSLSVIIKQHISFQLNTLNSFPVLPSNLPGLLHQASYRGEKVRSYVLLPLLPSLLVLASLDIKSEKRKWEKYRGLFYIIGCLGDTYLQTYPAVHMKYVQLFVCDSYLIKEVQKRKQVLLHHMQTGLSGRPGMQLLFSLMIKVRNH